MFTVCGIFKDARCSNPKDVKKISVRGTLDLIDEASSSGEKGSEPISNIISECVTVKKT